MPNVDHVAALELLRDEGAISDEELEDLKGAIFDNDASPASTDEKPDPESAQADNKWMALLQWPPTLRADLHPRYPHLLLVIAGVLVLASLGGIVSWPVSFLAVLAMTATLMEGGIRVTVAAGILLALILTLSVFGGPTRSPAASADANDAINAVVTEAADPGSVGIRLGELADLWNGVDEPPSIARGITRNTESGEYDSFIYRFDNWGRLAGAYDPSTDSVFALLATGQLSNQATNQLYLHLCFAVHPYSQGCIDSYFEQGLDGGTLADFSDTTYQAEWKIDEMTWRLDIASNVLTIRVLGPAVS